MLNIFLLDRFALAASRIQRMHTGHSTYHIIVLGFLVLVLIVFGGGKIL